MRFIITQDKSTYEALIGKLRLMQTLNGHTETPTWIFLNSLGVNFSTPEYENLRFCLSDTMFFQLIKTKGKEVCKA